MRRILIIFIMSAIVHSLSMAQTVSHSFKNVPMPQALKTLASESNDMSINFMYDELEDFVVTTTINSKSIKEAVRQVIGFYPIRMTIEERSHIITLECTAKTAKRFRGKILDDRGIPLQYATIVLLSPRDSSFIAGGLSNEGGDFVIPASTEEALVKVSYVGYITQYVHSHNTNFCTVNMPVDTYKLDPVSISGNRFLMDNNGYSISININDMQASDMLVYLPEISLRNNNYYIKGHEAYGIFINGQPIANPNELCNLPSEIVKSIKVDYQARTINIILRRLNSGGISASLYGGELFHCKEGPYSSSVGGVLYSRIKGLSIYDKIDYSDYSLGDNITLVEDFEKSFTKTDGVINPNNKQLTNRISLTQELNQRHSIGVSYYIALNRKYAKSSFEGSPYIYETHYSGKNQYIDHEGTIRYSGLFGKRNISVNAVADLYSRETSSQNLSLYGTGVGTESSESPSIQLWKLSADIKIPLSHTLEMKYGYDIRFCNSLYDPSKFVSNFKGAPILTYKMQLKGLAPTVFGDVHGSWKSFTFDAGCKAQLNKVKLKYSDDSLPDLELPDSNNTQYTIGLYTRLQYIFGRNNRHTASLNYQSQLDDIPYAGMSPFIRWNDPYDYSMGNPSLQSPSRYMFNAELSLWNNLFNIVASYQYTKNEIYWQTSISSGQTDIFYTRPININISHQYSLYTELNLNPLDCWQMKVIGQLSIRPEHTIFGGTFYDNTRFQQYYSMTNRIKMGKTWSATLNAYFTPQYTIYDRTYYPLTNVSGEVTKSFFNDKLLCRLSFTALGNKQRLDRRINNMILSYRYTSPVQMAGIQLVWKFSRGDSDSHKSIENGEQKYNELKDR